MSPCRAHAPLLLAEPDGTLDAAGLARLEAHVATCPTCRRQRAALRAAGDHLRATTAAIPTPDPAAAWRALRPQLTTPAAPRRATPWIWSTWAAPLAAAALFTILLTRGPAPTGPAPAVARADYVQAADAASTLVYVDQASGWLIVWATTPDA